jgi:hypothetical protein
VLRSGIWGNIIYPFTLISFVYMFSFYAAIFWLLPFQADLFTNLTNFASLLFLPHGVRVLSAWMYGWRSIPLIAPAALVTHWLIFGNAGFSILGVVGAMSGVISAALCFWWLSRFGMDFRISAEKNANWRDVMLAGSLASIVNTVGMGVAMGNPAKTMAAYFIGDITGLFGSMVLLMFSFKIARRLAPRGARQSDSAD